MPTDSPTDQQSLPWYRRARRLGQTNLVEVDAFRFDVASWREQWRRTKVDGVLVNCGGIAAYYPTDVPGHQRAQGVDERDLFGEVLAAARADGLAVLARMDSNRADQQLYDAHPDWFCVDAEQRPYRRGEKYATCVSTDYYDAHMPAVFAEVIERYAPDGFADNGWAGLDRDRICHCQHCARRFADATGRELPLVTDWDDDGYLAWVDWNYARRTELWDANNAVTRGLGGPDCLWLGMLHGQVAHNANVFQDSAAIARRTPVVLLDHQRRHGDEGFEQNAEVLKRIRGTAGWDVPVFECTALYDMGYPAFRLSSMPRAEVELWMTQGWAGGASPWWHHIGAVHDDRRQHETAVDLFGWHAEHQDLLTDRTPVASVGVVWSQTDYDRHGRGDGPGTVVAPYAGVTRTLVEANLLFVPVEADDVATADVDVLVLPDLAVMSDAQVAAVRAFVERGGSLVATGESSLFDERGRRRPDFALADLFGAHATDRERGGRGRPTPSIEVWDRHSYLRREDDAAQPHPVLAGLGDTGTTSFGGHLPEVVVDDDGGAQVLLTYVPEFPIFPPELAWVREPRTDLAALLVREHPSGGRVVFSPADLDRCAHREEQPDHATVLAGAVSWALGDRRPLLVDCEAPVSTDLHRHATGCVLHLGNLLYTSDVPGRQARIVPFGPVRLSLRLAAGERAGRVRALVAGVDLDAVERSGDGERWLDVVVDRVGSHEVLHVAVERTGGEG